MHDFVEQTGVTFPIVIENNSSWQFDFPPSISPYPRQVLINADGDVVYLASEHRDSDLRAALESLTP